ncbi:MAG TPA: T9SS type A sorting domain-containing protein [Edaphocola sp.]|nr:T9SS type A sorting domain-containing protein [Edaphocola sp.]
MKQFLTFSVLLFLALGLRAQQPAASSCSAPDSILNRYQNDADRLALRQIFLVHSPDTANIRISPALSDTFLNAFIAVYNATTIPARDTVVELITSFTDTGILTGIHSNPNIPSLRHLYMVVNPQLPWIQQLLQQNFPSGNDTIDSLISNYSISFEFEQYTTNTYLADINADSNYNMIAMANLVKDLPDVYQATSGSVETEGDYPVDIEGHITPNYVDLVYTYSWGDCPAGCIWSRSWEFKVYYDCSVEFSSSFGTPLGFPPSEGIATPRDGHSLIIYPNPFSDYIEIRGLSGNFAYEIYNTIGQKCVSGSAANSRINGLHSLAAGSYCLHIQNKDFSQWLKLQKQE